MCAWFTSQQLAYLSSTFYSISVGNVSTRAWSASQQLENLSSTFYKVPVGNISSTASSLSQITLQI